MVNVRVLILAGIRRDVVRVDIERRSSVCMPAMQNQARGAGLFVSLPCCFDTDQILAFGMPTRLQLSLQEEMVDHENLVVNRVDRQGAGRDMSAHVLSIEHHRCIVEELQPQRFQ